MNVERTRYFSIPVPHKSGELARFTKRMREAGVNLTGLWGFGMGPDRAELLAVPADAAQFLKALAGTSWQASERTCFLIAGEDRVGSLCDVLEKLAAAGINLEAVSVVAVSGRCGGLLFCDAKDVDKVGGLLGA